MKLVPSKRTLKRMGIGLGTLIGLLLLINAVLAWRTETRFEELVARIRAEGAPASIAELASEPIPVDRNAAALIDALAPELAEFGNDYGRFYQSELGQQLNELQTGELPSDEQVAAMRAILDRHQALEEGLQAAFSAPRYASTADFSMGYESFLEAQLERLQQLRTIARFGDWKVQVLLSEGKQQEAIDFSLAALEFTASCKAEPTVVSYLVTVAMRSIALTNLHQALEAAPVDAMTHDKVDETLDQLMQEVGLATVFRTERALSISACIEQGWKRAPPVIGKLLGWPTKWKLIAPIAYYDEILPLADIPYYEVQDEFQAGGSLAEPTGKGVLADLLVPSITSALQASTRDLAHIRALRVANALQKKADAQGLDDIDVPNEAKIDPFTGKPLVVRQAGGGWLVYSVGEDQADDNGALQEGKDFGFHLATADDSLQ